MLKPAAQGRAKIFLALDSLRRLKPAMARRVIIDYPGSDFRPRISVKDKNGKTARVPGTSIVARYLLPAGAHIFVQKGQEVFAGDVLAKIPRETTKTKDITGGLPRVAELFEARKPKARLTT